MTKMWVPTLEASQFTVPVRGSMVAPVGPERRVNVRGSPSASHALAKKVMRLPSSTFGKVIGWINGASFTGAMASVTVATLL